MTNSEQVFLELDKLGARVTKFDVKANHYTVTHDKWDTWQAILEAGRSYLVGSDVPMETFIRTHKSPLVGWMPAAFRWCSVNPLYRLKFSTPGRDWYVYKRGEYVTFELPHHDAGGEKAWVSCDGKSRILINVD